MRQNFRLRRYLGAKFSDHILSAPPLKKFCEPGLAKKGHYDVVKILIEDEEADYETKDRNNMTPLMLASREGHLNVVKYLLENEANIYHITKVDKKTIVTNDNSGLNALELALEQDHKECAKSILLSDCWAESLRNVRFDDEGNILSPMRVLIIKYPDLAGIVLNRSIVSVPPSKVYPKERIQLNFEFIEDLYRVDFWHDFADQEVDDRFDHNKSYKDSILTNAGFRQPVSQDIEDNAFEAEGEVLQGANKLQLKKVKSNYTLQGTLQPDSEPYSFRDPSTGTIKTPIPKNLKNNHVLHYIKSTDHLFLLKHPLVLTLLDQKWRAYGKFWYYIDLFLYLIFLVIFNLYAIFLNPPVDFYNQDLLRRTDANKVSTYCENIKGHIFHEFIYQ